MLAPRPLALLTLLALASATPALASGPLTSAVPVTGSLSSPGFTESWTFTGTAGQRVILVAVTTGGGAMNTVVTLHAPGGGIVLNTAADRSEYQLVNTGTFTVDVSDLGLNDAGNYTLLYLNLTAGPLTSVGDADGGAISSGEVRGATIGGVADLDAFTFSGTAGQRILFGALEGTASPFNVTLTLYPPGGGGLEASTSGGNVIDVQLASTGTYTVVVEDVADDDAGSYTVSHLNVTGGPHTFGGDTDGGAITSAIPVTGTASGVIDWDAFTFTGNAGDRIVVVGLATGGTLNTEVALYPPNGGAALTNTAADRWDIQLTQSGTHTLVIKDSGFGDTGSYLLTFLNLTSGPLTSGSDSDGGAISSGEVRAATISGAGDLDAFTFSGVAGQRILFGALEGSAPPFNTTLTLYPPNGGSLESSTSGGNQIDVQLAATGTYTVVVEDIADDDPGSYTVSHLNVTGGPHTFGADTDGGAIVSGTQTSGTTNGAIDWDAYTFTGNAGDRIVVVALTTGGTLNTEVALYPPNGGAALTNTAADRWDLQLTQSGTHTLVVKDANFGDTGTYVLSFLNLTAGPLTSGGDTDGGAIASGEVRSGAISGVADIDAFTFSGVAGQRILFGGLETSVAPFNTTMWIFPPSGGAFESSTSGGNKLDLQLAATGTYTVLIEDVGDDATGGYKVSLLNVTGGPHTFGTDLDGGPLASGAQATGTMDGVLDWDAFTITGTSGDRIVAVALATSGTLNTVAALYPPNGGPAQIATAADRWEFQLTQSGTHTLVIEDQNFGDTGTYGLTWLDLTAGPWTTLGDPDGGTILSDHIRTGSIGTGPDLDAFSFTGVSGDRVVVGGPATSGGPFNTTLYLFPPGGGGAITSTSGGDRMDVQLPSNGTYVVLVEDTGDNDSGSYALSYLDVTAGPLFGDGDIDGAGMSSGQVRNGTIQAASDLDVYWFQAAPGDNAIVSCVTTSGTLNTTTYLYPPGGGGPVIATSADNWNYPVPTGGRYALLVQHSDLTQTGGYQLGLSGSLTNVDVPRPRSRPATLAVSEARPNPSSRAVTFALDLPRAGSVRMAVFDVRGALVRTVLARDFEAGTHALAWDGRDDRGRPIGGGLYFVRIEADGRTFTRRVMRIE